MGKKCPKWLAVIALVVAMATIMPPGAAEQGSAHHHDDAAARGSGATGAAPSPAARTVREQWRLVRARASEIRALIIARKLGELHKVAYALRDLVAGLLALSGDLPEERRKALASSVKYVATIAGRLDAAGDAGDQSAAETSLRQLSAVLGAIEALYPPDVLGPTSQAHPGGRATITGEIVDATCYLEKGEAGRGPAHRECALQCIKEGRPPFVRDEATGQLYLATFPDSTPADRERWLAQVGTRVRVTGRVVERDGLRLLAVEEVRGEHDHKAAPHGGVVGMVGERHFEVVTTAENEIHVYLLDAFMKPLSVGGAKGTALIKGGETRRAALAPDARGEYLRVMDTRLAPGDEDITVTLESEPEPLTMTLPFRQGAASPGEGARSSAGGDHAHRHGH